MRKEVQLLGGLVAMGAMVGRSCPPGWQMPTALPFVDLSVDRFFARAIGAGKAKRVYFLVGSLEDCEYSEGTEWRDSGRNLRKMGR